MSKPNPESRLVKACLDYLAARGVLAWRNNTTGVCRTNKATGKSYWTSAGRKGVSDILGVAVGCCPHCGGAVPGRSLAVECKVGKGRLTDSQREFLADLNAAGGLGLVVRDDTDGLDDAIREQRKDGR